MKRLFAIVGILLLGAYLRWMNLGAEPFLRDQAVISLKAANVARGSVELSGPPISFGGINHSPLSNYLYAIPFRLAPDPRLANLFTGAMNLVAISLLYLLARRYTGPAAGLIAALLFAVQPVAVTAGRFVWNTNLAAPFVMLFLLTGFLGYYEDRGWARVCHLPALSLAGQCHPVAFLLAPLSALFWAAGWRNRARRPRLVWQTLAGAGLALILLLPWVVGYAQEARAAPMSGAASGGRQGLRPVEALAAQVFSRGGRSAFDGRYLSLTLDSLGERWRDGLPWSLPQWLTGAALAWLVVRAVRQRRVLPEMGIVLAYLSIPFWVAVFAAPVVGFYWWPMAGVACWVQGTLLGESISLTPPAPKQEEGTRSIFSEWGSRVEVGRLVQWIGWVVLGVLVALQLWVDFTADRTEGLIPLRESVAGVKVARAAARAAGRELLLVVDDPRTGRCLGCSGWESLPAIEGDAARVVWDSSPLPLPAHGALLFGLNSYAGRPSLFAGGEAVGPWFRLVELAPADHFAPDLRPVRSVRFSNGAAVLGFLREKLGSLPTAGETWRLFVLWRGDAPESADHKLSIQLVDGNGNLYAQADPASLPLDEWRGGETVMSRAALPLGGGFPATGPLYLRFGFYDEQGAAQALDGTGQPAGPFAQLQVRGDGVVLASWPNGVQLNHLASNSPLPQGPPLKVTITWHAAHVPTSDFGLRWRLIAPDGQIAFESLGVADSTPMTEWPDGLYLTEKYSLRLPTGLGPGPYRAELQAVDEDGRPIGEAVTFEVEVQKRDRVFVAPVMQHGLAASLGGLIDFLGYDLQQSEGRLDLRLYWRAAQAMAVDYKYFVHLWANGQLVAGADGMPEAWQYPTSWWVPGEVVSEAVSLDVSALPPGEYSLTTGFYDPATNERLPVTDANGQLVPEGSLPLGSVSIK